MKKYLLTLKFFTILLVFVLTASMVNAQTRTASVTGNWNSTVTWGGASVPTSANDVVVNVGITVTVNVAAACNSLTINGGAGNGGITISGANSLAATNSATINAATTNNDVNTIAVGAGTFSAASLTMADVVSGNGNTDVTFTISTGSATISGAITMNGSTTENFVNITGAGSLTLGSISQATGSLSPSATSSVNYTGSAVTIRPATYNNLTISGSGATTVTGVTVNSKLSMQGTATATGTSITYGGTSTLEYAGSAAQTSSNAEFPAASGPQNLRLNNGSGVTLHAARTIAGQVDFTNGILFTTSTNILILADNATAINSSDNSFVDGPFRKTGNDAFTFPVGKSGSGMRTIGISAPSSPTSIFTAEFLRSNPQSLGNTMGVGLVSVSACEYWTLANTGTASNASVILSWSANSNCGGIWAYVGNTNTLRVARLSGSTWNNEGRASTTGNLTAGTITSAAAVTTFGTAFALGTSADDNALPVMFSDVKAFEKNGGVQVEWSNLTERDLLNYIVERSSNGQTYSVIDQQLPKSNQNDKSSYSTFDASPVAGANFYRIKVLEISGKIIYSKILRVDIGNKQGFTLYPNPVKSNQVSVTLNNKLGQYHLKVLNSGGQEVYSQKITHQGGAMTQAIQLPSSMKPGVYNMMITGDNYRESKMFVVQ